MDEVLSPDDLLGLGLEPGQVRIVEVLGRTADGSSSVYRIHHRGQSLVLKVFAPNSQPIERAAYELLQDLDVPTPALHVATDRALLLEDLGASPGWRLAVGLDVSRPEVGVAVARWYHRLHAAGELVRERPMRLPDWLGWEIDALTPNCIMETACRLQLQDDPFWSWAAERISALTGAIRVRPFTLTYNDFHWTNLAISRPHVFPVRALVFDYHLLGLGMRYSDWRNVSGSLAAPARRTFRDAYGPVSEFEALLDAATADLYSLVVAAKRPKLPGWAGPSLQRVRSGLVKAAIVEALEAL